MRKSTLAAGSLSGKSALSRNPKRTARALLSLSVALFIVAVSTGLVPFLPGVDPVISGFTNAWAAGDPVIAAAGDIACDPLVSGFNNGLGTSTTCRQKYTSDLLVNAGLAAVLDLGDNQYYCGGYHAFLESYNLSWGRVKSITHPSVGNHEYITSGGGTDCTIANEGAAGYYDYFGTAAGTRGQGYYSFNVGTWHIIALNSNCGDAGGCGSGSPQYNWLKTDLATHNNYCTLAYWHIPLFSSGGRASVNSKPFWQLLYNYNADVILNGHDHIYERFAPQDPNGVADSARGIRQFTVGTGGSDHTSVVSIVPNSLVRNADTYGVLKLTLHPASYAWQFVPENGKTFTDSSSRLCHGSATPTPTSGMPAPSQTPTPTATTSSITFQPVADTYVNSSFPATNYGAATILRADASPDVHAYIRFQVSGLNGKPITRVRLRFFINAGTGYYLTARAVASNSWGETTTTYGNAPALGSAIANSGSLAAGAWVTVTVTPYVTAEGTYSFGIVTPSTSSVGFSSREAGSQAPALIVDLGP